MNLPKHPKLASQQILKSKVDNQFVCQNLLSAKTKWIQIEDSISYQQK